MRPVWRDLGCLMSMTTKNPYDHGCRRLLRLAGVALLCWLLRVSAAQLKFVRWLDTRLTIPGQPERVCDTIAHVLRLDQNGLPWAIPVEFQAAPDEQMPGRALAYEGLLWMQEKPSDLPGDRFHVVCCVVN